jgi:hypothetical protein
MTKWNVAWAMGLILLAAASASAQRRGPARYSPPYGPTISPYLQYYNRPVGVLGNYYTFVRPEVQLRATLRAQQQQIVNVETQVQAAEASRIRAEAVAPTGTGSTFMNRSHFYPGGP